MPLKLICLLLVVSLLVSMPTLASEPMDGDIESLTGAVEAAEKVAAKSAQFLNDRRAEFSKSSFDHSEVHKFLVPKGLKANDCSACHKVSQSELKNHVTRAFDLRMKLQRAQLADAESKLEATRENLDRREEIRDKIVERRMDQLISGADSSWLGSDSGQSKLEPASDSGRANLKPIEPGSRQQKGSLGEFGQQWQDLVGLSFINSNDPLPDRYKGCVKVTEVKKGSPAAYAGLSPGDLLIGLNDWAMIDVHAMDAVVRQRLAGKVSSRIKMFVIRDGKTYKGTLVLPDSIIWRDQKSREDLVKLLDDALIEIDKQIAEAKKKSASSSGPAKADPVGEAILSKLAEKIASSKIETVSLETTLSGLKKLQEHELYLRLSKLNEQIKDEADREKYQLLASERTRVMLRFDNFLTSTYEDAKAAGNGLPGMIEAVEQKLKLHVKQQEIYEDMLAQQYERIEAQRKAREGSHAKVAAQRLEQQRDELLSKKREIENGLLPK